MIEIKRKEDCVGCAACVQVCPKQCISFDEDEQGFRYPKVDLSICIHCNLCEKVCPAINQAESRKPEAVFAARNNDEAIQYRSSSGGVFQALAASVIAEGGVVFGARFDKNNEVIHDYTETLEGIRPFQTSKYLQSRIGETFKQAQKFLKEGRKVMFTGTPCQLAGLRLFLRKDWGEQLLAVDVVCHGVPSPAVWREYVQSLETLAAEQLIPRPEGAAIGKNTDSQPTLYGNMPVITGINFRDKRTDWEKFGFTAHAVGRKADKNSDSQPVKGKQEEHEVLFETLDRNLYMQGFLKDIYLRPACYECPAKCGKSHSDITLADFWGLRQAYPEYFAEGCYSLLLANTDKGQRVLKSLDTIILRPANYENALLGNPAIERSARKPKQSSLFWTLFPTEGLAAITATLRAMRPSLAQRIAGKFKLLARNTLGDQGVKGLKSILGK